MTLNLTTASKLAVDPHEGEHGEHNNGEGYSCRAAEKTKRKQCAIKDNRADQNQSLHKKNKIRTNHRVRMIITNLP